MGSWGWGVYDNDHAGDMSLFIQRGDVAQADARVERHIREALTASERDAVWDHLARALVVADMILHANGEVSADSGMAAWIDVTGWTPADDLAEETFTAIGRLLSIEHVHDMAHEEGVALSKSLAERLGRLS